VSPNRDGTHRKCRRGKGSHKVAPRWPISIICCATRPSHTFLRARGDDVISRKLVAREVEALAGEATGVLEDANGDSPVVIQYFSNEPRMILAVTWTVFPFLNLLP
jgi:hypothetical protein